MNIVLRPETQVAQDAHLKAQKAYDDLYRVDLLKAVTAEVRHFLPTCVRVEIETGSEYNDEGGSYETLDSLSYFDENGHSISVDDAGPVDDGCAPGFGATEEQKADIGEWVDIREAIQESLTDHLEDLLEYLGCEFDLAVEVTA